MRIFLTPTIIFLFILPGFATDGLKMYEKEITIPTYLVDSSDKVPYFYTGRAYQGAQGHIYPYAYNGNLTDEKKDVVYKGLFLENEYLEICVLPELGGRLYYMIDKTNGYNVLYRNNVIKPSLIGMVGAWISGGSEWNVPHHHRASTFMPTDYELTENSDGSSTIWVGEMEIRHQTRWMVGLSLYPENAVLKVDFRYINQTPLAQSFLIWSNNAVHVNENYQVIYPPLTEFATYHSKNDFTEWPISNQLYRGYQFQNADISWWKNVPQGGSFFAWEDQGEFVAGIDHGVDAGICIVGNPNVVIGKKLWTWGTSPRAKMWDQILSDDDGPYIEIMTGAYSNNQPDYSWCDPYFTKEATMYFMPLRGMNSVKESTIEAAVNLEVEKDKEAVIEVHAYAAFPKASIDLSNGHEIIWQKTADLDPASPLQWKVNLKEISIGENPEVTVKGADGHVLVNYMMREKGKHPLPETVKPPKSPDEIATVEALCFTGLRLEQIYNPSVSPLPYYLEAVDREVDNAFANLLLGRWYLKEGLYEKAENHLRVAADRWTTDYTRSKDCEVFYLLGLAQKALGKEKEASDSYGRATWDYAWYGASHLELSMMASKSGQYMEALDHINKSLSVNVFNVRANEIKVSLLRRTGLQDQARDLALKFLEKDPLDLYMTAEQFLLGDADEGHYKAKMRSEIQNYLDVAVKYGNCGFYDDAIMVLQEAANSGEAKIAGNPLVWYYLAYFNEQTGNRKAAEQLYAKAAKMNLDGCFPFRFETEHVFASALQVNKTDDHALYLWGNLLFDHQPELAMKKWESAVAIEPGLAMAQRNIAFGADYFENDPEEAAEHIALAIQHDPDDAVFYFEQDNYSQKLGVEPEKRLADLRQGWDVISERDNPLSRVVNLEIMCGEVDKALETLQKHHFRKVEGVGNIHDTWVDAWLVKGQKLLASGRAEEALQCFEKTLEYPRNLDIGENNRESQSHYFIGKALESTGKKKLAKEHYSKAVAERNYGKYTYYQGLAYTKLGEKEKARDVFNGLVERGNDKMTKGEDTDYFAKFGDRESPNVRMADALVLRGLGNWGLGNTADAEKDFTAALKQDPSNFEAKTRLFDGQHAL